MDRAVPPGGGDADNDMDSTEVGPEDGRGDSDEVSPHSPHHDSNDDTPSKVDPKDPSRPRRKKARRACFACQRAHLTCGDERPCLRCIKRGLQDHCHDGVRKKAKYLHDAPPEALVPGLGGSYSSSTPQPNIASPISQPNPALLATADYVSAPSQSPQALANGLDSYQNLATPDYPNRDQKPSIGTLGMQQEQDFDRVRETSQPFSLPFDPSDPRWYNLDNSGLNFGNTGGLLEYNMLGHMSLGAFGEDVGMLNSMGPANNMTYDNGNSFAPNDFGSHSGFPQPTRSNSGLITHVDGLANAFAIGEGNGSIASASPGNSGLDANMLTGSPMLNTGQFPQRRPQADPAGKGQSQNVASTNATTQDPFATMGPTPGRRARRDPSYIYQSIREPYSYTTGFHLLTAFLARRFSKEKTLRIAKALASIRPSFISCTRELSLDDLIFMEQGFQRQLLFLNDYINAYGCPTLICRRTGEIAAVSKEFCLLTGWRRDVLLGKEPNQNVNYGSSGADPSGASSKGASTPVKAVESEFGRPQPVFIAELLDDDTAVQFYDDFAQMAFGDSRGQVQRRGKLLKYKTKNDPGWAQGMDAAESQHLRVNRTDGKVGRFGSGIDVLGEKDGKVDVMFCHMIRRDFDIPMMIIMNFLPVIP